MDEGAFADVDGVVQDSFARPVTPEGEMLSPCRTACLTEALGEGVPLEEKFKLPNGWDTGPWGAAAS